MGTINVGFFALLSTLRVMFPLKVDVQNLDKVFGATITLCNLQILTQW